MGVDETKRGISAMKSLSVGKGASQGEDKGRGAKSSASFPVLCSEKTTSTEKNTNPLNGFLN
jgi:hypothetical protein